MSKLDVKGSVELGDTVRNGLLEAAEGTESQSRDREEEDLTPAPAVREETTNGGPANRTGTEVIESSKNVQGDGAEAKVLSQGEPDAK